MAITIRHRFSSAVSDAAASGFVKPSNWNDGHDISLAGSSLLGRYANTPGAAQEISPNGDFDLNTSTGVLSLASSGVVAGSYNHTSITVDAKGRITSIGSGTPTGFNAASLLAMIVTVDGAASGLDADLLDGQEGAYYAVATDLSDHIADTAGAHAGTAISFAPAGNIAAITVQAAIEELDTEKLAAASYTAADVLAKLLTVDGAGSTLDADLLDGQSSAFYATATSVSDHIADATAAHAATAIEFTPNGSIAATTVQAAIVEVRDEAQPLDADLTSIAALTTTAYGRAFLELADEAAFKAAVNLEIGTDVQAYDADLTTWAGLTPSANAQSLVTAANYAAMKALLDLEIGTDVQAYDADLTTWAGLTPSANAQSLVTAADYAAMRALLDLEVGTDFLSPAAIAAAYQPLDASLTAHAALVTAADKMVYYSAADTPVTTDITSVARTLVAQTTQALMRTTGLGLSANGSSLVSAADYAAMRALLDLEAGTDFLTPAAIAAAYQPLDGGLTDIAALAVTDGNIIVGDGANWVAESGATARTSLGLVAIASSGSAADLSTGIIPDARMPNLTGAVVTSEGAVATTSTFNIVVAITDGTGAAITTGIKTENDIYTSFAFTITGWTLLADTSGAIVVDVWRDTYANYPPTDADSITNGSEPEIAASGDDAQDNDVSDWTDVTMDAGIVMRFNVDSCTSIEKAVLILHCTKTS
jgi:hypothetical protein